MSFCTHCGAENAPTDQFCGQCGLASEPPAAMVSTPVPSAPVPSAPVPDAGARRPTATPFLSPVVEPQREDLAPWTARAGGLLLDGLIVFAGWFPLYLIGMVVPAFIFLAFLVSLAGLIYFGVQIGDTGQSPGMRVVGLRCVHRRTREPIGAGLGIVRMIAANLNTVLCYVGWLFPLWDAERQTIADKVMTTVVVRVPAQKFSLAPPP